MVVVGGRSGRWWSHAPPRAPRTMPVSPFAPKLVTDAILDSFKYYNFWLAKMSVRGFFLTSLARNAHGQCFFETICVRARVLGGLHFLKVHKSRTKCSLLFFVFQKSVRARVFCIGDLLAVYKNY